MRNKCLFKDCMRLEGKGLISYIVWEDLLGCGEGIF